ncbi:MAG: hypothetical protein IEMM0008_1885 [bacterium]|nr:MAG: hypothetical protein IEMM0008_1885 [bacterium]
MDGINYRQKGKNVVYSNNPVYFIEQFVYITRCRDAINGVSTIKR